MKYLFLDLDGVLTTANSRYTGFEEDFPEPTKFKPECVAAIERLLLESQAAVVIHSSWRKLPEPPPPPWKFPPSRSWWFWDIEWFKQLCEFQGALELSARVYDVAPYKFSSSRHEEIGMWVDEFGKKGDTYVVIDDEIPFSTASELFPRFQKDNFLIVETNDITGLTDTHVDDILEWWA